MENLKTFEEYNLKNIIAAGLISTLSLTGCHENKPLIIDTTTNKEITINIDKVIEGKVYNYKKIYTAGPRGNLVWFAVYVEDNEGKYYKVIISTIHYHKIRKIKKGDDITLHLHPNDKGYAMWSGHKLILVSGGSPWLKSWKDRTENN